MGKIYAFLCVFQILGSKLYLPIITNLNGNLDRLIGEKVTINIKACISLIMFVYFITMYGTM